METPFSVVEVEVNSRCNRSCWYCPVSVLPFPATPKFMSDEVFGRLVEELARLDFQGRFSYHLYNEPLLRRDLERLVAWVARRVPGAKQVLFTNGELLDDARYLSLRHAGIAWFLVTSHSGGAHPRRPFQTVQSPNDLVLTNRGGALAGLPTATNAHLTQPCHAPAEMLIVTSAGDVLLCYEDSRRQHVFGNIMKTPLDDLWWSDAFSLSRALATSGRRVAASSTCRDCTNLAHVVPGTSHIF